MNIERGIRYYESRITLVRVHFPEGHVQCQYCPLFCRYEESFHRYSCRLTNEWLLDVQHTVGDLCPLEDEDDAKEE